MSQDFHNHPLTIIGCLLLAVFSEIQHVSCSLLLSAILCGLSQSS